MPAETHTHRNPIDRETVAALVRERVADVAGVDPDDVPETATFEELDIDTMAVIELAEGIEEELGERTVGFHLDDDDLEDLHSVSDTIEYVLQRLG